ncbi:DUF4166 domain-containing protein [Rhizobium sp. AB2/73]|uniref:DUF4166 domain-containing protein n=1 Tax=Rhizobium TaxID=379 RepID=UPI000DDF2DB1|nr:DUF4166 domain-containing protein [Rhizobium sp. AB2/73]QYA15348.1 DUF4166 domain-containing protein [Rhizobium sp. AB2/73]UEQ83784.1 DUF4166 domain-containing protein [Rhizobium sp. AB2/73]
MDAGFFRQRFYSRLSEENGHLVERLGPFRFALDLPIGGQRAQHRDATLVVPVHSAAAPSAAQSIARGWAEDDSFHFDAPIALPLIGPVVHYRGWLQPIK